MLGLDIVLLWMDVLQAMEDMASLLYVSDPAIHETEKKRKENM